MSWNLVPPPPEEMAAIVAALEACWPRPLPPSATDDAEARTPTWRWSGRWWGPSHGQGGAAARSRPWRG